MSFFANLRIAQKSLLPIFLFALLCAGMTAFAAHKAGEMSDATQAMVADPVTATRLAGNIDGAFTRMHQLAYEVAVEADDANLSSLQSEFQAQLAEVKSNIAQFEPLLSDSEKATFAELTKGVDAYVQFESTLMQQRQARMTVEAESTLQDQMTPVFDGVDKAVTELRAIQKAEIEAAAAEAKADYHSILFSLVLAGVLGVLSVGAVALWISSREIAGPVAAMTRVMEKLAAGDTGVEVKGQQRRDEIGSMAKAVQVFKDNGLALTAAEQEKLRMEGDAAAERQRVEARQAQIAAEQALVVKSVGDGLSRLQDGDLLFRLPETFPSDYRQLRDDFNGAMAKLQDAMRVIGDNAVSMQGGAGEIASAADDLSRRTEQQAASLEETAAALDQITATLKRSAASANEANAAVTAARTDAEASQTVVQDAIVAMGEIEKSSSEIGNIIGVIDEIAFQTNLLALNAGVEAARAGDAGKGFAVVAQEVRALAQRSKDAAQEIKDLIAASTQQVGSGVQLVGKTGKALTAIVERVREISALVGEIAASSHEQSVGLAQVNTAINQMDQVTQQNAAMVEQSTAASHALSTEATTLNELVGRFQTGGARAAQARPARAGAARAQMRTVSQAAPAAAWEEF